MAHPLPETLLAAGGESRPWALATGSLQQQKAVAAGDKH
jgi:hypothetical protein